MPPREPITVTILAGGRGSRLGGVDKAALDLDGQPVLEHVLAALMRCVYSPNQRRPSSC